jgi:hypothetical protein
VNLHSTNLYELIVVQLTHLGPVFLDEGEDELKIDNECRNRDSSLLLPRVETWYYLFFFFFWSCGSCAEASPVPRNMDSLLSFLLLSGQLALPCFLVC